MFEAYEQGVSLLVLPELCLTGYTCSDLFLQEVWLDGAGKALLTLTEATRDKNMVVLAGLPLTVNGVLYNVAAVLHDGDILGFVPKSYLLLIQNFMKDAIITAVRILRQMFYLMEERIHLVPDFCSDAVRCRFYPWYRDLRGSLGCTAAKHQPCTGRGDGDRQSVSQ